MRTEIRFLQLILSLGIGIALLALMPVYSEPFVGCPVRGFGTLVAGCSTWPDLLLGFVAVVLIAVIGPESMRPHLWGLALMALVTLLGGVTAIKVGAHLDVFTQPENLAFYWRGAGMALFVGGLLGAVLFRLAMDGLRRHRQ